MRAIAMPVRPSKPAQSAWMARLSASGAGGSSGSGRGSWMTRRGAGFGIATGGGWRLGVSCEETQAVMTITPATNAMRTRPNIASCSSEHCSKKNRPRDERFPMSDQPLGFAYEAKVWFEGASPDFAFATPSAARRTRMRLRQAIFSRSCWLYPRRASSTKRAG